MYIIFKDSKADDMKHKLHKAKEAICEIVECFEEGMSERHQEEDMYERNNTRRSSYIGRNRQDRYEDDYDDYDDYERDNARRGGSRRMRRY